MKGGGGHTHTTGPLYPLGTGVWRGGQGPHSHGLHEATASTSGRLRWARSWLSHAGSLCPRPPDFQGEMPTQARVSPGPHESASPLVTCLAPCPLLGNLQGSRRGVPAG